uniref:MULE transposase domain-containing protein n=1 Tax=Panagrolaimus davidi TaxID=227884 RepID=A0A914PPG5_9BILA
MSNQSEADYKRVFGAITRMVNDRPIHATVAHFDREKAAVNAFQVTRCFRHTQPKMCVFHVKNCLHNKVVSF